MPFSFSSATRVYFNTFDLSPYLSDASLEASIDTAESTTFADTAKTYVVGARERTFSASGYYDGPSQLVLHTALLAGSGVLTFCPGGASAIGDLSWLSSVIGTSLAPSAEIAGVAAFAWDAQVTARAAFGYVLHPLATDTNTTTGANRDDTASTTTGWTMHLHVTAVTAGSWVVKLVDASASNFSDVADVTGGAFTAATVATQQRLVSASGATLRRYVRYVATRTGGSAGDSITFHLSLSRTYAA